SSPHSIHYQGMGRQRPLLHVLQMLLLALVAAAAAAPLADVAAAAAAANDDSDRERLYLITSDNEDDLTPDQIRREELIELLGAREDSMGKRSLASGRLGFRPSKRSLALGRTHFRPGKRSVALGRMGFRPGKRSLALGRNGFRPGKRMAPSIEADYYQY
ncbi:hypothetical protein PFISCL1PPCAC_23346, partial [Pristionchus fissidentatus]